MAAAGISPGMQGSLATLQHRALGLPISNFQAIRAVQMLQNVNGYLEILGQTPVAAEAENVPPAYLPFEEDLGMFS